MIASSRPSRFRCWKCWSTMTPGRMPRPAAIWTIRCLGVPPLAPNATMWVLIADAPALVPATTEPCRWRPTIAWARLVPPMVELSRSWLPPVRNTPVASARPRAPLVVVRLGTGHGVDRRRLGRAELGEHWRYISPASGPSDEALLMTAMRASGPPASATNRLRIRRVADLVLGAPDDDDVPFGHGAIAPVLLRGVWRELACEPLGAGRRPRGRDGSPRWAPMTWAWSGVPMPGAGFAPAAALAAASAPSPRPARA